MRRACTACWLFAVACRNSYGLAVSLSYTRAVRRKCVCVCAHSRSVCVCLTLCESFSISQVEEPRFAPRLRRLGEVNIYRMHRTAVRAARGARHTSACALRTQHDARNPRSRRADPCGLTDWHATRHTRNGASSLPTDKRSALTSHGPFLPSSHTVSRGLSIDHGARFFPVQA